MNVDYLEFMNHYFILKEHLHFQISGHLTDNDAMKARSNYWLISRDINEFGLLSADLGGTLISKNGVQDFVLQKIASQSFARLLRNNIDASCKRLLRNLLQDFVLHEDFHLNLQMLDQILEISVQFDG